MIHTYSITGVTCNGCMTSVKEKLMQLSNISNVETHLKQKKVTITMDKHVAFRSMQQVLKPKYSLIEPQEHKKPIFSDQEEKTSEIKQLFPLFLIFGYMLFATIIANYKAFSIQEFMLDFMGLFYMVFSFFKFLDYKGFLESFKMYDPLAKKIPVYGFVYPFIEVVLGIFFLARIAVTLALIVTIIILGITTIGVIKALLNKQTIKCACLGTVLKLPMTKATLIENTLMIVMAIFMLIKSIN